MSKSIIKMKGSSMGTFSNRFDTLKTDVNHSSKEKNKRKTLNSQDWSLIDPQPRADFKEDPFVFATQRLTYSEKRVLNFLLSMNNTCKEIFPSQAVIANDAGISKSYAGQVLGRLQDLGFIATNYRHLRACVYKVSTYFDNPHVRSQLSSVFSSLRSFALVSLISSQAFSFYQNNSCQIEYKEQIVFQGNIRYLKVSNKRRWKSLKESIMSKIGEAYEDNPISPAIRGLKNLNLTKWGQIKLSAFPDEVILTTYDQLNRSSNLRDPFNWFMNLCLQECSRLKIRPDWIRFRQLAQHYNMPEDPQMVLPAKELALQELLVEEDQPIFTPQRTRNIPVRRSPSKRPVEGLSQEPIERTKPTMIRVSNAPLPPRFQKFLEEKSLVLESSGDEVVDFKNFFKQLSDIL